MSQNLPSDDFSSSYTSPIRKIYAVSDITSEIKILLEKNFPFIWVSGEISNFRIPASGHFYFVLKDHLAQIDAVMFKGQNRSLKFKPEDGMMITGLGRINVYEPRGSYQIIFEYLEPEGIGAIQIAFEQLKEKLSNEGLFDPKYKKALPFLPQHIGIITSPTGAVIHDILNILDRRFPNLKITIVPVSVQGIDADREIESAIQLLNEYNQAEVIILARGGGSLEDLAAFNSEKVARTIFLSQIPIISAVGHETDFTIADFVADVRAPTPSAAAEIVIPQKTDLLLKCDDITYYLIKSFKEYIAQSRDRATDMSARLIDPKKRFQELRLKLDDMNHRLLRQVRNYINYKREYLNWRCDRLLINNPINRMKILHNQLYTYKNNLLLYLQILLDKNKSKIRELNGKLTELSPMTILSRGYSITRTIPDRSIVRNPNDTHIDQRLEIIVEKGSIIVTVRDRNTEG